MGKVKKKKAKLLKGEYGYRDQKRRMRLAVTLLFLAAILIQLTARFFILREMFQAVLTVSAILTVLPMANVASPLLASWRYRTPTRAAYEKACAYETKAKLLYDLILTTKEQVIPLDVIAIHPIGVFGLCPAHKLDVKKAQKGLGECLTVGGLDLGIQIFIDEEYFYKRMDSLKPMDSYADSDRMEDAALILKSLSM